VMFTTAWDNGVSKSLPATLFKVMLACHLFLH